MTAVKGYRCDWCGIVVILPWRILSRSCDWIQARDSYGSSRHYCSRDHHALSDTKRISTS